MGRGATKAVGNAWYEARIEASKYNQSLASREGAAEALHMSVDAVTDAELGLSKVMPVDKAVLMADLYNKPTLLNYYCLHECPIGRNHPISDEVLALDRVTVSLIDSMSISQVTEFTNSLLRIASDGKVTPDEMDRLEQLVEYLQTIALNASRLKNILDSQK